MINGTPEVMRLTVDLHEHLVDIPPPLGIALHPAHHLSLDVGSEHGVEPVPPQPNRHVANIDAPFED